MFLGRRKCNEMPTVYISSEVEVGLSDFDDDDLIDECISRGYIILNDALVDELNRAVLLDDTRSLVELAKKICS
jgi:hypothetical protein